MTDKITGKQFLVDSGACLSLIPAIKNNKDNYDPKLKLHAANGDIIPTYGKQIVNLNFGNGEIISWPFVVADVSDGILGMDFLTAENITIHPRDMKIIFNNRGIEVAVTQKRKPIILPIYTKTIQPEVQKLLDKYPDLVTKKSAMSPVKHTVRHKIITTGAPIAVRPRRLNIKVKAAVEATLERMLEEGTIRPSSSPWASPLHVVPKKSGDWRIVGDYRLLNMRTKKDAYPLPYLRDFSNDLYGCNIFSNLDLREAYHQIPIDEEDVEKTALCTPYGAFEYMRMSFGLTGAAQTFQRFIDNVLRGLSSSTGRKVRYFAYLDDILIASTSEKEHLEDLELLFQRLTEYGLCINKEKCTFATEQLDFLGHTINIKGVLPQQFKVDCLKKFPKPKNIKELRRYLGMINYYHNFVPRIAEELEPLNNLLRGSREVKSSIKRLDWNKSAERAFEKSKTLLSEETLLNYMEPDGETAIAVDASDTAVAGVLQQYRDGVWKPIAFFSKRLEKSQMKYSTFAKELFAVYASIKNFRPFVEGREFYILTDHQPLLKAFPKKSARDMPREERWLEYIATYTTDIRHVKGIENVVADALSRYLENYDQSGVSSNGEIPSVDDAFCNLVTDDHKLRTNSLSFEEEYLKEEQLKDQELKDYLNSNNKWSAKIELISGLYANKIKGITRFYLPLSMRREVLQQFHDLGHPGQKASLEQLSRKYIWPGMKKDIKEWCKRCIRCQKAKVIKHNRAPLQQFPDSTGKLQEVHIDLVGPLPSNQGFRYLLTMIDRYTRWTEAIPLVDMTAKTVTDAFLLHWVARYGVPRSITSDRGTQFESRLWKGVMEELGIDKHRTTSYHPQSNGIVERFHRTLKNSIRAHADNTFSWLSKLPHILLSIRTSINESTKYSAAQTMFGMEPNIPANLLLPYRSNPEMNASNYTAELLQAMRFVPSVKSRITPGNYQLDRALGTCTHVLVRNENRKGLAPNYKGPFKVLERKEKYFKLELPQGPDNVSIDRLKVCYTPEDYLHEPAEPNLIYIPPPLRRENNDQPPTPPVQRRERNNPLPPIPPQDRANAAQNTPARTTRSGRIVRLPKRFKSFIMG